LTVATANESAKFKRGIWSIVRSKLVVTKARSTEVALSLAVALSPKNLTT
jgi:hypothetical protein